MPVRPSPFAAPQAAWGDLTATWGGVVWTWAGRLYGPLSWGGPGGSWGRLYDAQERDVMAEEARQAAGVVS